MTPVKDLALDDSTLVQAIASVTDPEIPVLSVVDMGIIVGVRNADGAVEIDITPTFSGCPALDVIRREIKEAVLRAGARSAEVRIVYHPPWTSDRLTPEGRRKLKEFGLAPPGARCGSSPNLDRVACPLCNSDNTEMESLFGPTLCRSIHYCRDCLQSFEHFKAV